MVIERLKKVMAQSIEVVNLAFSVKMFVNRYRLRVIPQSTYLICINQSAVRLIRKTSFTHSFIRTNDFIGDVRKIC